MGDQVVLYNLNKGLNLFNLFRWQLLMQHWIQPVGVSWCRYGETSPGANVCTFLIKEIKKQTKKKSTELIDISLAQPGKTMYIYIELWTAFNCSGTKKDNSITSSLIFLSHFVLGGGRGFGNSIRCLIFILWSMKHITWLVSLSSLWYKCLAKLVHNI